MAPTRTGLGHGGRPGWGWGQAGGSKLGGEGAGGGVVGGTCMWSSPLSMSRTKATLAQMPWMPAAGAKLFSRTHRGGLSFCCTMLGRAGRSRTLRGT